MKLSKQKKTSLITLVIIIMIWSIQSTAGVYSGGTGSSSNPYKIATANDLIELSLTSDDWTRYFIQTEDIFFNIDPSEQDWDNNGSAGPSEGFLPIGNNTTMFSGFYDGQLHTISYLYINRSSTNYVGLFGYILGNGENVRNLGITDADVTGNWYIGMLAGYVQNATVLNCFSAGNASGPGYIGGLAGYNDDGTISNCFSLADITGNWYVGGLVGYSRSGTIKYSFSTGDVDASGNNVGGFAGYNINNTISDCFSLGNINRYSGTNIAFGGFCGDNNQGTIMNCYSTGSVNFGTDKGFIGNNEGGTNTANFFDQNTSGQTTGIGATAKSTSQMKSSGTFSGWNFAAGNNNWVMSSIICFAGYPVLQWTGAYSVAPSGNQISSLMNLVWIAEAMSIAPTADSRWTNLYTQTQDIVTWTTPGWDGNQGWTPIGNDVINFTGLYHGQNHIIRNLFIDRPQTDHIGLFGNTYSPQGDFKDLGLINVHITGNGQVGSMIGYCSGSGQVSNCYSTGIVICTGTDYAANAGGLFGIKSSGSIANCHSDAKISCNEGIAGGIVGKLDNATASNCFATGMVGAELCGGLIGRLASGDSNINNCYATGNVYGVGYGMAGGLLGMNSGNSINNSYATGDVIGGTYVGGLVGSQEGSLVNNCYATGNITGTDYVGGLIGANWVMVANSYSTGTVTASGSFKGGLAGYNDTENYSEINNCFWDMESSGISTSNGGTGKATSEMKTISTFTDGDWDFVGETANGENDYWNMLSYVNDGYPYLNWQIYLPIVTTEAVSSVTTGAATGHGNIENLGVPVLTQHGVCWNTSGSPVISDSRTEEGTVSGNGGFSCEITGLTPNTEYFVRAYATNEQGTSYGNEVTFQTNPVAQDNYCLNFNEENDYVSGSGFNTTITAITVETWVNINSLPENAISRFITIDPEVAVLRYDGSQFGGPAQLHFYIKKANGSLVGVRVNNVLTTGEWLHIAGTCDGNQMKLYLNGELISSATPESSLFAPNGTFGFSSASENLDGKLDEIRVWNIVRTQQQIRECMHLTLSGIENGLINYWQFNEGSGTTASDNAGGCTGFLNNMTQGTWVYSTIPAGIGVSYSATEKYGNVEFSGTGAAAEYDTHNAATVTVSKLHLAPNRNPDNTESFNNQYWIIDRFGNGSFDAELTLSISEGFSINDENNPRRIRLYRRNSNSDGGWSFVTRANSVSKAEGHASFLNISNTGQFMLTRSEAADEVFVEDIAGNSLEINGINEYIDVGNDVSFDLGNVMTIEAWLKPQEQAGRQGIFSSRYANSSGSFQLEIGTGSGGTKRIVVSGVNTWVAQTGDNVYNIDNWTHIAYVRAGIGSGTHKIYVNGVLQTLISDNPYDFVDNTAHKVLGSGTSGAQFYKGMADEIRIWNIARSEEQIRNDMYRTLTGYETGLVSYYQFNEGSGTTTYDNVSLNNGMMVQMSGDEFRDSTAPIPFISVANGNWLNESNWQSGQGFPVHPWSRVKIDSDITLDLSKEVIQMTVNEGKNLIINPGIDLIISGEPEH